MVGDFFAFKISDGFDAAGLGHQQTIRTGGSIKRPDKFDGHALADGRYGNVNRGRHTLDFFRHDGLFAGANVFNRLNLDIYAFGLEHSFLGGNEQSPVPVPGGIGDDNRFRFGRRSRLRRFGRFALAAAGGEGQHEQ